MVHTLNVKGMHRYHALLAIMAMLKQVRANELMEVVGDYYPTFEQALRLCCRRQHVRQLAISRRGQFFWLRLHRVR